jgi:hypothetical protein
MQSNSLSNHRKAKNSKNPFGDPSGIERSCCCRGVCIGILRPEAESHQTEIDREIKKQFKEQLIAERDSKAEYGLICKADGGMEVHDDSWWRVVMDCEAKKRQHVKINC